MNTNKTKTTIEYVPQDSVAYRKPVPRRYYGYGIELLPGQSPEGYGKKITTDWMIELCGRHYRIYATCFSNVTSHYVIMNKQKLYLHDYNFPENR